MDTVEGICSIEQIRQVKHRYLRCVDLKMWDEIGDTLTESAILDFGTTDFGGSKDAGTVFEISATGQERLLHSFSGENGQFSPAAGLIFDGQGNLYLYDGASSASGQLVRKVLAQGFASQTLRTAQEQIFNGIAVFQENVKGQIDAVFFEIDDHVLPEVRELQRGAGGVRKFLARGVAVAA